MATRRRPSEPRPPAARGWAVTRRVTLPPAANDNRLPPGLRALRVVVLAAALAGAAWLLASAF
jgi:hypothetical protein